MLHTLIKTTVSAALLVGTMASFAGDLSVSEQVTVNASPETTWKMLGDFNHLDVWHPVVVASELTQGKSQVAGAVRVLTLGNGANITEKLVANNNALRSYTYAITESPLPIADYVSTISVTEAKDGQSTVVWTSTFDAKGVADNEAKDVITGIYKAGLNNLDKHFNQ